MIIYKYRKISNLHKFNYYLIQRFLIKWLNRVQFKKKNKKIYYLKKTNLKLNYKIYIK